MSWNTQAVSKFLNTVRTARAYNSREVKLSIADAEQLALSLAEILNQERELTQLVMQLQHKLINRSDSPSTEISMNGGSF